mmetsp:Transcript_13474/g.34399  ORF Transcript_13474/g.34399 Transcript_13474/m.34399 type:complete len:210 (+) Transcript_13474:467-1096(+)
MVTDHDGLFARVEDLAGGDLVAPLGVLVEGQVDPLHAGDCHLLNLGRAAHVDELHAAHVAHAHPLAQLRRCHVDEVVALGLNVYQMPAKVGRHLDQRARLSVEARLLELGCHHAHREPAEEAAARARRAQADGRRDVGEGHAALDLRAHCVAHVLRVDEDVRGARLVDDQRLDRRGEYWAREPRRGSHKCRVRPGTSQREYHDAKHNAS